MYIDEKTVTKMVTNVVCGILNEMAVGKHPAKQGFSSDKTSINQNKLPRTFGNKSPFTFKKDDVIFDLGGGKFDNAIEFIANKGGRGFVYDPFNRSSEHNKKVMDFITNNGGADVVTCNNVLNVIDTPLARKNVILQAAQILKPEGSAYFCIYSGDGSGIGKPTKSGWQENRKTIDFIKEIQQHFQNVNIKHDIIIAQGPIDIDQVAYFGNGNDDIDNYYEHTGSFNK